MPARQAQQPPAVVVAKRERRQGLGPQGRRSPPKPTKQRQMRRGLAPWPDDIPCRPRSTSPTPQSTSHAYMPAFRAINQQFVTSEAEGISHATGAVAEFLGGFEYDLNTNVCSRCIEERHGAVRRTTSATASAESRGRETPNALCQCAGYIGRLADEPCCSQREEPRRHQRDIRSTQVARHSTRCPAAKSAGNPSAFFMPFSFSW
jgi:hypothetical protein